MAFLFENKAVTYLGSSLSSIATSITLSGGEGAKFPAPTGGDLVSLVLEDRLTGEFEIVYVTNRTGDVLTVQRAREDTTAQSWPIGSSLSVRATAAVYEDFNSHEPRITQNEADIVALQSQSAAIYGAVIDSIYPVGAIYLTTISTNPATTLGRGTWVAFGQGRALVGVGNNGESTWTANLERGSETHSLTTAELAAHVHLNVAPKATTNTYSRQWRFDMQKGDENQDIIRSLSNISAGGGIFMNTVSSSNSPSRTSQRLTWNVDHNHAVTVPQFNSNPTGEGAGHNNIQPSIGVFAWKRTA